MRSLTSPRPYDRVAERRRAAALARHLRESEGLSNLQIAQRLGRSPATVKAYFYDPSDDNKRPTDLQIVSRANAGFGATRAAYNAYVRTRSPLASAGH